jgi:cellulose synthase/poly-beta-1,6-N-acetylglucosamine synthase-like glycosyltransferase
MGMSTFILKGAMAPLVNFVVTIGFSLLAPAFFIVGTLGLHFLVPKLVIDTTFLTLYFFIMCTCYNDPLMFVLGFGKLERDEDIAHYFSIIIPAHNEESVIGETLRQVLEMNYPSELFEVIVINDGSTDNTEHVVRKFQIEHPNVKLINILPMDGGHGKGAALNVGFRDFLFTWRELKIEPPYRWIIGVFDADGHPQADMLRKVSFEFSEQSVGAVQTLVRIRNRSTSFLAKLQTRTFIAFSRVTQFSRTFFKGFVALGGNGQFVRATALDTVTSKHSEHCWNVNSVTEDLDIGIRLSLKKWDLRYLGSTAVMQEGVETLPSLICARAIIKAIIQKPVWEKTPRFNQICEESGL